MESREHTQPQCKSHTYSIPLIDIGALQGNPVDVSERRRIVAEVADACKNWGLFQLVNHGIPQDVIEKARVQARHVFELPDEARWKAKRPPGSLSGYGNGAVIADAVNNEIASQAITFGYPHSEADVIASKLWTHGNPDFGGTIDKYNAASHNLALKILRLMIEGLPETNPAHFKPYLTEHSGVLRINNYPSSLHPDRDIGLPPHVDDSLLTIVHQGSEVEGLEVIKDGHWVRVPPRSETLTVIVAAVCQVLTNATYKAVQHRALPNPARVRLSLVYSAYPPPKISITPAPEFVSPAQPALYKPFTWSEYLCGRVSHILNPIDGLLPEKFPYSSSTGNGNELLHLDPGIRSEIKSY